MEVFIPHWMAEKICEHYGSLENYSQQRWGGALMPVDAYWNDLNQESQTRINERLSREWKRG